MLCSSSSVADYVLCISAAAPTKSATAVALEPAELDFRHRIYRKRLAQPSAKNIPAVTASAELEA